MARYNCTCILKHACRVRKALENRTNMEDDRITLLEGQLGQARLIAEESDKKYEEVSRDIMRVKGHAANDESTGV